MQWLYLDSWVGENVYEPKPERIYSDVSVLNWILFPVTVTDKSMNLMLIYKILAKSIFLEVVLAVLLAS